MTARPLAQGLVADKIDEVTLGQSTPHKWQAAPCSTGAGKDRMSHGRRETRWLALAAQLRRDLRAGDAGRHLARADQRGSANRHRPLRHRLPRGWLGGGDRDLRQAAPDAARHPFPDAGRSGRRGDDRRVVGRCRAAVPVLAERRLGSDGDGPHRARNPQPVPRRSETGAGGRSKRRHPGSGRGGSNNRHGHPHPARRAVSRRRQDHERRERRG